MRNRFTCSHWEETPPTGKKEQFIINCDFSPFSILKFVMTRPAPIQLDFQKANFYIRNGA
jgi:hypothetical protein